MPNVTALQNEEEDPVNSCDDEVEGERSPHMAVLSPYRMTTMTMFAVCGGVESVVQGCNDDK